MTAIVETAIVEIVEKLSRLAALVEIIEIVEISFTLLGLGLVCSACLLAAGAGIGGDPSHFL